MSYVLRIFLAATFVLASTGVSSDEELAVVTHSLTVEERLETIETIDVTANKELKTSEEDSVDDEIAEILDEANDADSDPKPQESEAKES